MTSFNGRIRTPENGRLPEIRAGLRTGIEGLARRLLGEPVRGGRTIRTLKFGTRSGSLHVEVSGRKQGLWYDHAESTGGDALALIQHVNGGTFSDAVAWAAGWLGIDIGRRAPDPDPARAAEMEAERKRKRLESTAQDAEDAEKRIARARWLWSLRKPLSGSLGALYLAGRSIAEPAHGWPDCVAFLSTSHITLTEKNDDGTVVRRSVPCGGAVILAATGNDGELFGTQRIYLGVDALNIRDGGGGKVKITNGVLRGNGAVVRLPRLAR